MMDEQEKKVYVAPSVEVIALAHGASLLDSSEPGEDMDAYDGEFG